MEIVYMPSGGVRGVPGVVSIVSGKNGKLPFVILDSDQSGKDAKKKLLSGLYQDASNKIIEISEFVDIDNCEFEDIIPHELMNRQLDRFFKDVEDDDIEDALTPDRAVVTQIEAFSSKYGVKLDNGWKVDLSRSVKQQLLKAKTGAVPAEYVERWVRLFNRFNEK